MSQQYQYARTYQEKKALGRIKQGDEYYDTLYGWCFFQDAFGEECSDCHLDFRRPIPSDQLLSGIAELQKNQPKTADQPAHLQAEPANSKLTRPNALQGRELDWPMIITVALMGLCAGMVIEAVLHHFQK
jgi:hypothetical protein